MKGVVVVVVVIVVLVNDFLDMLQDLFFSLGDPTASVPSHATTASNS